MTGRKSYSIAFAVTLPTAAALWAYFYTASLTLRVIFLENSIGPLLLWHIRSPLSLSSIAIFAAFLIAAFSSCILLQRKKKSLVPFASFWHLALTPLILSPISGKFPEFIPLALVLLPAASIAAFLVLIFRLPRLAGQRLENPGHPGKGTSSQQTVTSSGILEPRLAPYTVWVITFFILLTSGLYVCERGRYTGGDEGHYFTIARSIHQDHDVDLTNNIRHYRKRQAGRFHISRYSRGGHAYSWHPVGLSVVFAPLCNGVNDYRETLVIMCIIGAFLASQMYLAAFEETGSTAISFWAWIILSFSSPLWFYSFRAWPFMPGGLCMLYAWRRMPNLHQRDIRQTVIMNLLLTWLLWLHDSFIICYGILGIFLLYHWIRKPRNPGILTTVILQALNISVFFLFHYRWFGKALFGQQSSGFTFWPGMLATWFDHYRGMVFAAPVHLLCFVLIFIYAFRKRNLSGFLLLGLYLGGFIIGTAGRYWTGGSCHPGRRLVEIIPLTCVPLGYFLLRKKNHAFYWLAAFLSFISLGYMSYFILNQGGLRLPINYLPLSDHRFRTIWFHLPAFGRGFNNFPWTHVGAVSLSFALLALFWVILLARQKNSSSPKPLLTGMYITLLWTFLSLGWMKTHFDTFSPIPWNTTSNCVGERNRSGIGYPPLQNGRYRYLICKSPLPAKGTDKARNKLSWSIEMKGRLPTYLDLAKGRYRFQITGTGKPLSTGTASIYSLRQSRELYNSPIRVDVKGELSHQIELNLLPVANRITIKLESNDDDITFKTMTITPLPNGLESLMAKIERKGEPSGWIYLD